MAGIVVRYAQEEDLKSVFKLNEIAMQKLSEQFKTGINIEFANANIIRFWEQAPCFILCDNDKIVGFFGLTMGASYHVPKPIISDYMFYILPKYAKFSNIKALCNAARDFADSLGFPIYLNYLFFKDADKHKKMYERLGFKVSGLNGVYHGKAQT